MKTLEEQNKILVNFDKTFDPMNFADCVNRAILLLKNRQAQINNEDNISLNINFDVCRIGIEKFIEERELDETMMSASMRYVEKAELIFEMWASSIKENNKETIS